MILSLDLETYSDVDLLSSGVYRYAESDNFEILLLCYSIDNKEPVVVDLAKGETIPEFILEAILNNLVTKWAFNSQFERVCLSYWIKRNYPDRLIGDYINPHNWKCSMIWSAYMGMPRSLAAVGSVLKLDEQKLTEGKELIKYFCVPCRPTKSNKGRTRNLPEHDIEKWELFKKYNKRDVEVEISIKDKFRNFPVPDEIWEEFWLDQEINDRGIEIDMELVENAIMLDTKVKESLINRMKDLTGLDNPNSVLQLKGWLKTKGIIVDSLDKKAISELITKVPGDVKKVLELRQKLAKSSVKKYQAMASSVCKDNRARGMFRFYGANRTGRFSGAIIQLQNLPQNHLPDLAEARGMVKHGDFADMEMLYDNIPDILSQLIRTAFIPRKGYKFVVADYSAIEARVLAYLAGEDWVLDTFARGDDIYCATASRMFHCNVVKHGENGELRQKGKQATLSCGYGGSVGALIAMGALESGMKEEELQPLVDAWREANPNIVSFWWGVDKASKEAVQKHYISRINGIEFSYKSGIMFIRLPSGRCLAYVRPKMGENRFGGESVTYEGIGQDKKWTRLETFGGKLVENITQAVARDILMNAMVNMRDYRIVAHVHDELIIECPEDTNVEDLCSKMSESPEWMPDITLKAEGFETKFYKKD